MGLFGLLLTENLLYFTLSERNKKVTINNRNIKKGSAKYEQYDGCERRNGENGKNGFLSVGRGRERPRERKLRKGEHSFRQLKFQIFATELQMLCYLF